MGEESITLPPAARKACTTCAQRARAGVDLQGLHGLAL